MVVSVRRSHICQSMLEGSTAKGTKRLARQFLISMVIGQFETPACEGSSAVLSGVSVPRRVDIFVPFSH